VLKSSKKDRKCYIYDIAGQRTKSFILKGNLEEFSFLVTDLSPGIYTCVIENDGRVLNSRFIKK
jgi:hypothetical protein